MLKSTAPTKAICRFSAPVFGSLVFALALLVGIPLPAETGSPRPAPGSVVVSGNARFTVLTPQMIRMEWSANGEFEDHASLVFIHRDLATPKYSILHENEWLVIKTEKLELRYKEKSGKFTPEDLVVHFGLNGNQVVWRPGMVDSGNLLGTTRTLDGVKGSDTKLEPGLISRDGWVLVDDSTRALFDNSDWPWVMERPKGERQDWYLFAYGHDYKQALYDYTQVAGKIPLPPRFAFGTWWSRYWAYTDQELEQLVSQFKEHDVPLDVLVVDMDWHQTFDLRWGTSRLDQAGQTLGWTGYTWDKNLFPDPVAFLNWVHNHGLKTTLNLHPASGVQPHEERYAEMARAMGIDPATKKYIPFDITNKKFAQNYFAILHHPLEKEGVDFWWLDWQQEQNTAIPGVNPTWWLNYTHFTDMEREGKRPLLFHRWGGLGNHRYQVGFSGDTISSWESLAFQPYFTATATNVGYGYWSHDIGGHMPGPASPELYTRWVQFGAFSPILRTHATKNPEAERRIWAYPVKYAEVMRDAFLLRYALIPYIYTAGREAYDRGLSICRPLYYDWPENPEAYQATDEYQFGDDLIVAPVTTPISDQDDLATKEIWLPEGSWYEWSSGAILRGPGKFRRTFALSELPVYARMGAIIPMQPKMLHTGERPVDPLILSIFAGADGSTRLYEDAGDTLGYKSQEFSWTTVRHTSSSNGEKILISAVRGAFPGMQRQRAYELRWIGDWPVESVLVNGKPLPSSAIRYDGNRLTTIIAVPELSTALPVEIMIRTKGGDRKSLEGIPGAIARLTEAMQLMNGAWPKDSSPDSLIRAAQMGDRISLRPNTAQAEIERFRSDETLSKTDIKNSKADEALKSKALAHLSGN